MKNIKTKEDIEKVLEKPVFEGFDENTLRIRRNLLIFSFIGFLINYFSIDIKGASFLGLEVENLDTSLINNILVIIIFYHLCHFFMNAWDFILWLKIRITGTFKNIDSDGAIMTDPEGEYLKDKRNSTFYWWFSSKKREINRNLLKCHFEELEATLKDLIRTIDKIKNNSDNSNNIVAMQRNLDTINKSLLSKISNIDEGLKFIEQCLKSNRIEVSMERFDKGFWNFQKIHVIRLLTIEYLLPIIFGFTALYYCYK